MSTFLYHHGVKGQQWGVLNGPPYPIDKKIIEPPYGKDILLGD